MRKPGAIKKWLSNEELTQLVLEADGASKLRQRLAILLSQVESYNPKAVAEVLQVSPQYIYRLIGQYNRHGAKCLHPPQQGGRRWAFLSPAQESELMADFERRGDAGEVVRAEDLLPSVRRATDREVSLAYVYQLLDRHGWEKAPPRAQGGPVESSDQKPVRRGWRKLKPSAQNRPLARPASVTQLESPPSARPDQEPGSTPTAESNGGHGRTLARAKPAALAGECLNAFEPSFSPQSGSGWKVLEGGVAALLQRAKESERARISRDLHDDLGATLTEIGILAAEWANPPGGGRTKAADRLRRIAEKTQASVQALDAVVWAADPAQDTLASLAGYLGSYVEEFSTVSGLKRRVDIQLESRDRLIDPKARYSLFLAVKESVHNTIRHAKATEITIKFHGANHRIEITISDNGRGFDLAAPSDGRGLANLRERLANLGGSCQITSQVNAGTIVALQLPLSSSLAS